MSENTRREGRSNSQEGRRRTTARRRARQMRIGGRRGKREQERRRRERRRRRGDTTYLCAVSPAAPTWVNTNASWATHTPHTAPPHLPAARPRTFPLPSCRAAVLLHCNAARRHTATNRMQQHSRAHEHSRAQARGKRAHAHRKTRRGEDPPEFGANRHLGRRRRLSGPLVGGGQGRGTHFGVLRLPAPPCRSGSVTCGISCGFKGLCRPSH